MYELALFGLVGFNEAERSAKLLLTFAAKQTIKNGLALLGVKAPEKM